MTFSETRLSSLFVRKRDHFLALTGLSINLFRNQQPWTAIHRPRYNSDLVRLLERSEIIRAQIRQALARAQDGESLTFFYPLSLACTLVPLKKKWGSNLDYHLRLEGFFLDCRPNRFSVEEIKLLQDCGITMSRESLHETSKGISCLAWDKLQYLAAEIAQLGEKLVQELEQEGSSHPGIRRGMDYIHANLEQEIDLRKVAQHAGMSHCHFSRVFRQETGESFTRFVSRLRCHRALDMMKSGNQRISEIAFHCGFQSLSQFNRSFVGFFGKNPSSLTGKTAATARPSPAFSQNPVSE